MGPLETYPYGRKISLSAAQLEYLSGIFPKVDLVIELGVLEGGIGGYIYNSGISVEYVGYDIALGQIDKTLLGKVDYRKGDVFSRETFIEILHLTENKRVLIFCDNGNKKQEMMLYGVVLKKDDILAVHDYPTEVNEIDLFRFELKYPVYLYPDSLAIGLPVFEKL